MSPCTSFRITYVLLVGIITVTSGQKIKTGSCPTLTSFANPTFSISKLPATWKVLAWSPSLHRLDWKCVTYNFGEITQYTKYSVAISATQKIGGTARASGTVTVTGNSAVDTTSGTFFTFETTEGGKTYKWNYYIARTDNVYYLALYACENFLFGKIESAIILSLPSITDASITAALDALSTYGVSRSDLVYPYTAECL